MDLRLWPLGLPADHSHRPNPQYRLAPSRRRMTGGLAAAGLAVAIAHGACNAQTAVEGRPQVARSSADAHASSLPDISDNNVQVVLAQLGRSQLDFFDDLEQQPLVCHDDALHACLLLGAGINATSFEQRAAMAAQLGWIVPDFDRPAREAATVGEFCRIAAVMLDGRDAHSAESQEQALQRIGQVSPLPQSLRPYQGITGAQLLSILGSVHDVMTRAEAPANEPIPAAEMVPSEPVPTPIAHEPAALEPLTPAPPAPAEPPMTPQADSPAIQISDVPGVGPGSAVQQPQQHATTQPTPQPALDLSGTASQPANADEPRARESVIALDGQPAVPSADKPAESGLSTPPPSELSTNPPTEPDQPIRSSQYVPGKPIRRPTSK